MPASESDASRLRLFVFAVLSLAALVGIASRPDRPASPATGNRPIEDRLAVGLTASERTVDSRAEALPRLPRDPMPLAALEVHVAGAGGEALEDVELDVWPSARAAVSVPSDALRATTAVDGHARFDLPRWTVYMVEARRSGFATRRVESGTGTASIVLERSGVLLIETRDAESGSAVGGVTLALDAGPCWTRHLLVPAEGRLVLGDLPPGPHRLGIQMDGYLDYELPVVVPDDGAVGRCEVLLHLGRSVRGVVLDESTRTGLREGVLEAWYLDRRVDSAPIDASGRFELRGVHGSEFLRVRAPGYFRGLREFRSAPRFDPASGAQLEDAIVYVEPAPRARGVVVADGVPVEGARVFLGRSFLLRRACGAIPSNESQMTESVTGPDGSFALEAAPPVPGPFDLLVLADRFAPHLERIEVDEDRSTTVVLTRGASLFVRALDAERRPMASVRVRLTLRNPHKASDEGRVLERQRGAILTDDQGLAVVAGMASGEWLVEAQAADGASAAFQRIDVEGESEVEIDLLMDESSVVQGVVVDRSGMAVVGATVGWREDTSGHRTTTDESGAFALPVPRQDTASICVWGPMLAAYNQFDVPVAISCRIEVDRRTPDRTISGRVLDARTGRLVPLARRTNVSPAADLSLSRKSSDRICGGHFRISLPDHARGTWTFAADGYRSRTYQISDIAADELDVRLDPIDVPSQTLRVRLDRAAVIPRVLAIDAASHRPVGDAMQVSETEFDIDVGDAREVLVTGHAYGYVVPSAHRWRLGDPEVIDLVLRPGGGRIQGTSSDSRRQPLTLHWPEGFTSSLSVDAQGSFESRSLPPGAYTISVTGGEPVDVRVLEGGDTIVRL